MASEQAYLRRIDRLFRQGTSAGLDEGQLLERFTGQGDESGLEALIKRHGPMVLGVCRRRLGNPHDADDAFQATFLILIRKARSLHDHHRLGPWLHGVAYRVAVRSRADAARRRALEAIVARAESDSGALAPDRLAAQGELAFVIDEEISRLPARHRAAIVLCDLEGQTQHDAARRLGWSEGALRGRLARARAKLRDRLVRRGLAPSVLTAGPSLLRDGATASVTTTLVEATTRAATATLLAGRAAPSAATAISASVAALVQGVIRAMTISRMTALGAAVVFATVGLLVLGGFVRAGLSAADNPPRPIVAEAESPQPQAAAAATKHAEVQRVDFRVVRRSDNQPVSGATVECSYQLEQWPHATRHTTNDRGHCAIELPQGVSHFTVHCGKDGFVPTQRSWSEEEIRRGLAATYTQELEAGLPIGGYVKDEDGKPVVGAEVTVAISQRKSDEPDPDVPAPGNLSVYASFPHFLVTTDSQGRWRCSILPANADSGSRLWFFVRHHDYVSDAGGYARRLSLKTARAMTGTLVMKSGLHLAGEVRDVAGRVVAGATVILAYSPSAGNLLRATTDAAGRFAFPNANNKTALGRWSVSVEAVGFAPAWKMVVPRGEIPPLDFSLSPAKPFRGQVVDTKGRPVAGAQVQANWQECYFLDWKATTDADGRFVWLSGPTEGEIEFRVRKDGFIAAFGRRISALAGDVKITINPMIRVRGIVSDAETSQPIPRFRVIRGEALGNQGTSWRSRRGTPGTHGRFDVSPFTIDQPGMAFFIRIEADGYAPASSRAIIPGETAVDLELMLKKGSGPSGVVSLPDGTPAVGADVYLASPKYRVPLENNHQRFQTPGSSGNWVKTDGRGHFAFQPKDEPFGVMVLHPKGVAQKSAVELARASHLTLQPFGRIEGRLRIGSEPGANQAIRMRLDRTAYAHDHYQFFEYTTTTDDQGRFVIEDVMPGEAEVSRSAPLPAMGHLSLGTAPAVRVGPGQTVQVELGGQGRPVAGTVALPPDSATRIDLATASGYLAVEQPNTPLPEGFQTWGPDKRAAYRRQRYLSPEAKAQRRAARRYSFPIDSDGRFRIEDVLPGSYKLTIHLANAPGFRNATAGGVRVQGTLKRDVEVKPIPGGRSDEPLDLGALVSELEVDGQKQVAVGEVAPPFAIRTLDGKPLRMADFRGKFVLLDFWATWCGPCVQQEPHLKDAHDSFGKNDRFAMVGLSLDETPEVVKHHVAQHGLKWTQGFLGQGSAVTEQYGVASIPQIILIGPDGRVVARNLGGPGIKAEVSQALARRP